LLVVSLWSHCVGWFNRSLSLSGTESFGGVVTAPGRQLRWQDTTTAKKKKNREINGAAFGRNQCFGSSSLLIGIKWYPRI
jgi:hypothetical protein